MAGTIKLILALHNHQPVGNFDHVIEAACRDAYEPFLEVLEKHPAIPMALHFSGCLLEWLEQHRPEFCTRIAHLSKVGRIELMGGGYHEPILTMLPERDRLGQVRTYSAHLKAHYHADVRGAWVTERVWEPGLASSLAKAQIDYVALDDHHFKTAGVAPDDLFDYHVTEDQGHTLTVFPMSERLRYLIPFSDPEACVDYMLSVADGRDRDTLLVYADDGEKFGTWPGTYDLVYNRGWLDRFLTLLEQRSDRIEVVTFAQAREQMEPRGRIYLPDCSYREMTEWALPAEALMRLEDEVKELDACGRHAVGPFIRGGSWRNFKSKYTESNTMYARMLLASDAVASIAGTGKDYLAALDHLFRGQCNCVYWHGVFGGLYLPHLRDAAYEHLITAGEIAKAVRWPDTEQARVTVRDLDLDTHDELLLENRQMAAFFTPTHGAQLYELDLLGSAVNVINTMARRQEAYHRAALKSETDPSGNGTGDDVGSIHGAITAKEENLDQWLTYDPGPRYGLIDRVLAPGTTPEQMAASAYTEWGQFSSGRYTHQAESTEAGVKAIFKRSATLEGDGVRGTLNILKEACIPQSGAIMAVSYCLTNESESDIEFLFASELNFSMQSGTAPDRYYLDGDGNNLGHMDARLNSDNNTALTLVDEWRQFRLCLASDTPFGLWTYPVETVSISEAGLERIFQAACVVPHWQVALASGQTFSVRMTLTAEERFGSNRMASTKARAVLEGGVP